VVSSVRLWFLFLVQKHLVGVREDQVLPKVTPCLVMQQIEITLPILAMMLFILGGMSSFPCSDTTVSLATTKNLNLNFSNLASAMWAARVKSSSTRTSCSNKTVSTRQTRGTPRLTASSSYRPFHTSAPSLVGRNPKFFVKRDQFGWKNVRQEVFKNFDKAPPDQAIKDVTYIPGTLLKLNIY